MSQAVAQYFEGCAKRARAHGLSGNTKLAEALWASTLYSEYMAVLRSAAGKTSLLVVAEKSGGVRGSQSRAADSLYASLSGNRSWGYASLSDDVAADVERVKELVEVAKEKGNYDYLVAAAGKANEFLGTSDGYVEIVPYKLEVSEYSVPEETIKRIEEHVERLTAIFAKLGGRAEYELWKLIFSGYKENIVDTIEGISSEEKSYLRSLLNKPFERTALIFVYKRMGDPNKLVLKMLRSIYFRNITTVQAYTRNPNIKDQY